MPVQGSMQSLTAVAASNSPAGTDAISNTLDDYLRSLSGILRFTEAMAASLTATNSMSLAAATGAIVPVIGGASATTAVSIAHLGTVDAGIKRTLVVGGYATLLHSANLLLPGSATVAAVPGDVLHVISAGSGAWRCVGYQPGQQAPAGHTLIGITTHTSGGGSYTPATSAKALYVELVGGGGGAGGVDGQGAGTAAASGGGGGAGYCALWIDAPFEASYSYTCGAAGAGGVAGANNGSAGGASIFAGGAIAMSAGGGGAGSGVTAADSVGGTPGAGGTSSGGDINLTGGVGPYGRVYAGNYASLSLGGAAAGPIGGQQRIYIYANTGNAGNSYGGGGGPVIVDASVTNNYAGGAGAVGVVRIWEYR